MKTSKDKKKIIVILGPTSAGKTSLAVRLANKFNGEIISADSRQVYQGMDIGTGKDLNEYGHVPYHLIDIISPKKQFTLFEYQKQAYRAIDKTLKKNKQPFLVGGSPLYLYSIIDGYQLTKAGPNQNLRNFLDLLDLKKLQELANEQNIKLNQSDFNNKRRLTRALEISASNKKSLSQNQPKYDCLILGLLPDKEELSNKIEKRLKKRLKQGLVQEVEILHQNGLSWQKLDDFGLEYRFVAKYLQNELSYDQLVSQLATAIRQFAKRQMTWFKRDQRIIWLQDQKNAENLIKNFINKN